MKFSLKILENNSQIRSSILQGLLPQIDSYLKKALQTIKRSLPDLLKQIIQDTPEYNALLYGRLQYELGISDPSNKLNEIINIWINNIDIEYKNPTIAGDKIKAFFSVSLVRRDFSDVLSSDAAFVVDALRGYQLPWLEWLLLEGEYIIVPNQEVVFGSNKFSRTGFALMRTSNKSWKVPSEFAGTINNNWITRAIDGGESKINELLNKAFV